MPKDNLSYTNYGVRSKSLDEFKIDRIFMVLGMGWGVCGNLILMFWCSKWSSLSLRLPHLLMFPLAGIGWKSWKKRWFILTRTSLVFFKNDPVSIGCFCQGILTYTHAHYALYWSIYYQMDWFTWLLMCANLW